MKIIRVFCLALIAGAGLSRVAGQQGDAEAVRRMYFQVSGNKAEVVLPALLNKGGWLSGSFLPASPQGHTLRLLLNGQLVTPDKRGIFQFTPGQNSESLSVSVQDSKGKMSAPQLVELSVPTWNDANNFWTIDHSLYFTGEPLQLMVPALNMVSHVRLVATNRTIEMILLAANSQRMIYSGVEAGMHGYYQLQARDDAGIVLYSAPVNIVDLDGQVEKSNLKKGQRTGFEFLLKGLEGYCCFPVQMNVTNKSANTVGFEGSPNISMAIDSALVAANPYGIKLGRTATALQTGNFEIEASLVRNDNPPVVFAKDDPLPRPQPLKDEAILTGLDVALKKVWADAGGAKGKEWDQLCENCQKCLKARTGEWAEKLVKELGEGIIKEFAGKALDLVLDAAKSLESIKDMVEEIAEAKEAYDKAKDKAEKLEELKGKIEDAIRAGELKVVSLEPKMCDYCLISGLIFYCPQTGCVTAVLKCQGGVLCCPTRDNSLVLHYCTDDRGMPSDKRGGVGVEVIKK